MQELKKVGIKVFLVNSELVGVIMESTHIAISAISPNVWELVFYVSWWSEIVSPQNAKSTKSQNIRYSNRTPLLISSGSLSVLHAPPPPLPLLPSFIWISWEAICCMRLVPNHRNHVSIKCFPAWDAFITVSTIWICKMYDDRGQARNLNLRCYFNAVVLLFFHTVLTASRWLPKKRPNM